MKKKLLATVLTLALSLTIVQPSTIYAADNEKVTQAIATAEEKSFDTDYSVTWSDEVEECWSKITLNEQGIVKVNMTKPENKTLGEMLVIWGLFANFTLRFVRVPLLAPEPQRLSNINNL